MYVYIYIRFCSFQRFTVGYNSLHSRLPTASIRGYLAPPRTLQQVCAQGPTVVIGGRQFLVSEVPL